MTLSDADLDARLRAAGARLDELAEDRVARTAARAGRRTRDRRLAAAAALLVALAVGSTALVLVRSGDRDRDRVHTGPTAPPTTATPPSTTSSPTPGEPAEISPAAIRALGGSGTIVTPGGLVDLATGATTPLTSANNPTTDSPVAVPDGTGGTYYLSFTADADPDDPRDMGRTDLRHLTADGDEVVEPGVRSFALRPDGALALAVPLDPVLRDLGTPLAQIVVVAPDGTRTPWTTTPADYGVTAWAGDRLVGQRGIAETEAADLVVLDGPDDLRVLTSYGSLGAISSDGRWAVVDGLEPGAMRDDGSGRPPVLVVDLATGAEIGTVDLGDQAEGLGTLTWDGDDRLLAATSSPRGAVALVVDLAVEERADGTVAVTETRTITLDPRTFEPRVAWAGPDGTVLAVAPSSDQRYHPRLYVCPPDDGCALHELPEAWMGTEALLDDPSRPRR